MMLSSEFKPYDANRYPKHKGDKGQRIGGECNVTACTSPRAIWYNIMTFGLYCTSCAIRINRANRDWSTPVCVLIEDDSHVD